MQIHQIYRFGFEQSEPDKLEINRNNRQQDSQVISSPAAGLQRYFSKVKLVRCSWLEQIFLINRLLLYLVLKTARSSSKSCTVTADSCSGCNVTDSLTIARYKSLKLRDANVKKSKSLKKLFKVEICLLDLRNASNIKKISPLQNVENQPKYEMSEKRKYFMRFYSYSPGQFGDLYGRAGDSGPLHMSLVTGLARLPGRILWYMFI